MVNETNIVDKKVEKKGDEHVEEKKMGEKRRKNSLFTWNKKEQNQRNFGC